MPRRRVHNSAFTLIELILVLIIMSIMLALASPTLSGWGQGQKLRNAADEFVAATGYARAQAVANAVPYAVQIDQTANTYVVQTVGSDMRRTPVPGDPGQPATLPTSFTIRLVSGGSTGAAVDGQADAGGPAIVFYPDARVTPAVVEIKSAEGKTVQISSDNPATPFRKVEAVK